MSDATGAWTADFSSAHDIVLGEFVNVEQQDEDGDNTWIFYQVQLPHFRVAPPEFISGDGWVP